MRGPSEPETLSTKRASSRLGSGSTFSWTRGPSKRSTPSSVIVRTTSADDPELAAQVAAMEKQLHLMGGAGASASPLDTLLALSRALPPHLGAEIVDFTLDEGTIKLDGMADSFATVDRVKKALDLSGYFRDIQVTHATAGSDPSKVEFRLTAAVRGEMME